MNFRGVGGLALAFGAGELVELRWRPLAACPRPDRGFGRGDGAGWRSGAGEARSRPGGRIEPRFREGRDGNGRGRGALREGGGGFRSELRCANCPHFARAVTSRLDFSECAQP
jgi:hypothetical protein